MRAMSALGLNNFVVQVVYSLILFSLLFALLLKQNLAGLNIFDEGLIATGSMMVKDGGLPYRDFLSMYGPGQYYVTAAIFSVFGESLIFIRYLHVFLLAALGMAIYWLAKRASAGTSGYVLLLPGYVGVVLFAHPSAGYPAIAAVLFLVLSALALSKWADSFHSGRLALASSMIGVAGLFRWDFGIIGLAALAFTVAVFMAQGWRGANKSVPVLSWLFFAFAPAILILSAIYIPFLVVYSSPIRWYQEVLLWNLTEFPKWRNLEYVRPALWALLKSTDALDLSISLLKIAYLFVPVVMVMGAVGTVVYVTFRRLAKPMEQSRFVLIVYLGFLCLFLLNQMRVRPGIPQGFPALVASLPLLVLLWGYYKTTIVRSKSLTLAIKVTGFLVGAMLFNTGSQRLFESSDSQLIAFDTPRASGISVDPEMKPYLDLVKYVKGSTKPGEYIYSGAQDHSRLFINDTMVYFLTDRYPADRFLEVDPGIANTSSGQVEIIGALMSRDVRMIVLLDMVSKEPNMTSRSNGITVLDEFIRTHYHLDKVFGNRVVLVRNQQ